MARMVFLCSIIRRSCGRSGEFAIFGFGGASAASTANPPHVRGPGGHHQFPYWPLCRRRHEREQGPCRDPASSRRTEPPMPHGGRSARNRGPDAMAQSGSRREPDDLAQAAADAVSLHGVADLPRYGEANSNRRHLPRVAASEARKRGRRRARHRPRLENRCGVSAARRRQNGDPAHALRRLRPRVRRAATTLRPPVGRHASAKTMPALAHQFARLVSSFHGTLSAARKTRVFRSLSV